MHLMNGREDDADSRRRQGRGFTLTVPDAQAGWDFAPSLVPALRSPHELCAISNRRLRRLPVTSDQNTPDVGGLGASGHLIWIVLRSAGRPGD